MEIDQITNEVLISRLENLRSKERAIESELLAYLRELDRRKVYLELGYSSLFDFAVRRLGYSESGASRRIRAARCLGENPELAQMYEQANHRSRSMPQDLPKHFPSSRNAGAGADAVIGHPEQQQFRKAKSDSG